MSAYTERQEEQLVALLLGRIKIIAEALAVERQGALRGAAADLRLQNGLTL